jgi:hypothetical protein
MRSRFSGPLVGISVARRCGVGRPIEGIGTVAGALEPKVTGRGGKVGLSRFGFVSGSEIGGWVTSLLLGTDFDNVDAFRGFGFAGADGCGW